MLQYVLKAQSAAPTAYKHCEMTMRRSSALRISCGTSVLIISARCACFHIHSTVDAEQENVEPVDEQCRAIGDELGEQRGRERRQRHYASRKAIEIHASVRSERVHALSIVCCATQKMPSVKNVIAYGIKLVERLRPARSPDRPRWRSSAVPGRGGRVPAASLQSQRRRRSRREPLEALACDLIVEMIHHGRSSPVRERRWHSLRPRADHHFL